MREEANVRACITDAQRSAAERCSGCSSFGPALGAGVGSSLDSEDRAREDLAGRVRKGEGEGTRRRVNAVAMADSRWAETRRGSAVGVGVWFCPSLALA